MNNRKEYKDRQDAPLINPGFTLPEYEKALKDARRDPAFGEAMLTPLVDYYKNRKDFNNEK
jgi:hypothetical protein